MPEDYGHGRSGSGGGSGGGLQAPRHHTLNALSPLQSFSPLQPLNISERQSQSRQHSRHPSYNSVSSVGSFGSPSYSTSFSGGGGGLGITTTGHTGHGGGHRMPPLSTYNLNRNNNNNNNNNGPSSPGGPLEDASYPQTPGGANASGTNGETPSPARARTPSVTRSLSRRESIVANQGLGGMMSHVDFAGGNSYHSGGGYSPGLGSPLAGFGNVGHGPASGDRGGGFSKLTLVRAPSKGKNAGAGGTAKAGEDANGGGSGASTPGRRRTKSSSNLSPFSFTPSSLTSSISGPANLSSLLSPTSPTPFARSPGPADFGGNANTTDNNGQDPMDSAGLAMGNSTPVTRTSFLFDSAYHHHQPSNIHEGEKGLSPEQVMHMAESLKSPILASSQSESQSLPRRAGLSRSSSLARGTSFSTRRESDASAVSRTLDGHSQPQQQQQQQEMELEPVEYVEMNEDVLLPYVDRPSEVAELVAQPSNYELFDIIRPTFPKESKAAADRPDSWRAVDPEDWTWEEFQQHLRLSRVESDDYEWVRQARRSVRARSEALWERIGICLGCDGDLLNAGEQEPHLTTAALSDVFDGSTTAGSPILSAHPDDHFGFGHVWVEGLQAVEPEEMEMSDGSPVKMAEDTASQDGQSPLPGMAPALMDVVEEEESPASEPSHKKKPSLTPAQVAGGRGELKDPFGKTSPTGPSRQTDLPGSLPDVKPKVRAKSFVGVQISTSPSLPSPAQVHRPSYSGLLPGGLERGPGHPLFPSSFSTLSIAPTLPNNNPALKASLSFSQASDAMAQSAHGNPARAALQSMLGFNRKQSRSGLSESAITFGSGDD